MASDFLRGWQGRTNRGRSKSNHEQAEAVGTEQQLEILMHDSLTIGKITPTARDLEPSPIRRCESPTMSL